MASATSQPGTIVIRGGRVVDPSSGIDRVDEVVVTDGRIASAGRMELAGGPVPEGAASIDAGGLIVCPGLIDIHVHLREPGGEHKETIATGTSAAAAGGFTAVACMPNTEPPLDNVETIHRVRERGLAAGACRVYPVGAITRNRAGREVVDMSALKQAGAVAFSDDGVGVEDDDVMRAAFQCAKRSGAVIIQHCEYRAISAGGVMHKGRVSEALGLPGLDPRSEEAMIERDIGLVRETGARYHVAHISTARAIELVRRAKAEGLPVTAEVCTHHILLTDQACSEQDPNTKMHPPLRPRSDVDACVAGLLDGTIDCLCTDHAPHAAEEKSGGFRSAPPGIVGLETSLPLAATAMVQTGKIDWLGLINLMSTAPAAVLNLPGGSLQPGCPADLTLIDPDEKWRIDPGLFRSKARNTPFGGWEVTARPVATIVGGRLVSVRDAAASRFTGITVSRVRDDAGA